MKEQKKEDEHSSNPNLCLLLPSTPSRPQQSVPVSRFLSKLVSFQTHMSNIRVKVLLLTSGPVAWKY